MKLASEHHSKPCSDSCQPEFKIGSFIDGRLRPSSSNERFNTINPFDEEVLAEAAAASHEDVDEAVQVARARFQSGCWSGLSASARAQVLDRLADLLVEHAPRLALLDTLEMGKPISAARFDAESFAPGILRVSAGYADKLVGDSAPLMPDNATFNIYEPRGVIGAITPWNFPLVSAVIKIAPALAAGNTMVLKPSEIAPSSALLLAEVALEAGLPEGVLNIVPGLGASTGAALAGHKDVDLLSFTGSTATGRRIMEASARSNAKPMLLECGGKSPQVVFGDVADLDRAAAAIVENIAWNQGQVCSAHSRLLVEESIKNELVERIIELAARYTGGDPLDERTTYGPLASPMHRDRVAAHIAQAHADGARAVLDGKVQAQGGCFILPTVFDCDGVRTSLVHEEIFGPVLCVESFSSEDQAIGMANASGYGLSATVWTRDMGRGRRCAHKLRAGGVSVRSGGEDGAASGATLSYEPQKASGFGSERGLRGLQSYSTLKIVSFLGR